MIAGWNTSKKERKIGLTGTKSSSRGIVEIEEMNSLSWMAAILASGVVSVGLTLEMNSRRKESNSRSSMKPLPMTEKISYGQLVGENEFNDARKIKCRQDEDGFKGKIWVCWNVEPKILFKKKYLRSLNIIIIFGRIWKWDVCRQQWVGREEKCSLVWKM